MNEAFKAGFEKHAFDKQAFLPPMLGLGLRMTARRAGQMATGALRNTGRALRTARRNIRAVNPYLKRNFSGQNTTWRQAQSIGRTNARRRNVTTRIAPAQPSGYIARGTQGTGYTKAPYKTNTPNAPKAPNTGKNVNKNTGGGKNKKTFADVWKGLTPGEQLGYGAGGVYLGGKVLDAASGGPQVNRYG